MKLSDETANLVFDTGQFTVQANSTYNNLFISQNVNMRTILGEMYNRYKKFYIVFNSIISFGTSAVTYTAGTVTGITNSSCWLCGIDGLDFVNNNVDGQISTVAYFPVTFGMSVNGNNAPIMTSTKNGIVFNKPLNDNVYININPYLISNLKKASLVTTAVSFCQYNLSFTIYGLVDE